MTSIVHHFPNFRFRQTPVPWRRHWSDEYNKLIRAMPRDKARHHRPRKDASETDADAVCGQKESEHHREPQKRYRARGSPSRVGTRNFRGACRGLSRVTFTLKGPLDLLSFRSHEAERDRSSRPSRLSARARNRKRLAVDLTWMLESLWKEGHVPSGIEYMPRSIFIKMARSRFVVCALATPMIASTCSRNSTNVERRWGREVRPIPLNLRSNIQKACACAW